ncbi:MAG: AarF/UbiB family protein, partial [Clostridiaceae bacterium]|nr:AarF/UbiB family protein [Clostridiaceae bacterium]
MKSKSNKRFRQIIKVFSYYGFISIFDSKAKRHEKSPKNLRKAFEELGSTFIKIGQILSTRTDILPKEYIDELIKLQDSVAEEEFQNMKEVFEQSLGKKIDECFIYFDEKPIASASIAQVYRAVTLDGQHVVVKIQRPDIYEKIKVDISILRRVIKFTNIFTEIKFVDPLEVLQEIEISTQKELDFINEARNAKMFKKKNKDTLLVKVPAVIEELHSKKVLTLEEVNGIKVNEIDKLIKTGYDSKEVAKKLALCYCKQIFQDGFFHGDPHPGNILICEGKICFLDFGIVGVLEDSLKCWLNKAMFYMATNDKKNLVQFVLAVGIKRGK